MPGPRTIPALLEDAVARWPDGFWLEFGGESISFMQLRTRVDRTARALAALEVGAGSRVGLFMGNRPLWLEVEYAVTSLGAWLVPLNTMLSTPELVNAIRHSGMDTLIWAGEVVGHETHATLSDVLAEVTPSRVMGVGGGDWPAGVRDWHDAIAAGESTPVADVRAAAAAVRPDDVALVIYTSGTTGRPKGVLQTHRALTAAIERFARHLGLRPGDRSFFAAPLYWIHGCWHQALMPLWAGSGIVLETRFDPVRALERLSTDCTHLQGVPPQYEQILGHPDSAAYDISGLRVIQVGGTTFSETLPERLRDRAPHATMTAAYGLSEAGVVAYTPQGASLQDIARTVGRIHEGGEARIVDADDDTVVLGPGEVGELLLRSDCVTIGNLDDEEATARTLAGGWLHTGDLARMDERGYITIVGRKLDAYKRAGATVYTADAEAVLASHPDVAAAAVVGVPHPSLGEVGAAFVVLSPGAQVGADELLAFASTRLARYKIPEAVHFVPALPTTASGKVQKHRLREAALAQRSAA